MAEQQYTVNTQAGRPPDPIASAVISVDENAGPPPPYQASYGTGDVAPPEYSAAPDPNEAPPSYESLFGQVRAAKQDSSSVVDFMKKAAVILCGTIGCTMCVGIVLVIPISMIVIGAIYKDSCPIEPYIPIYLIVGGSVGVAKNILSFIERCRNKMNDNSEENHKPNPLDGLLSCFLCVWFIAGNIWIYRVDGDVDFDNTYSGNYCNETLYLFAFWITTAAYILMASVCFCICCAGMLAAASNDSQQQGQQRL